MQGIKAQASASGVADITRVRRESHSSTNTIAEVSSTNTMAEVSLEAIEAVAPLKDVYVLDMHSMTCLFHNPIFKKVLDLLTHSHIFAINMSEDEVYLIGRIFNSLRLKSGKVPVPFVVGSWGPIQRVVRYGLNVVS